MACQPENCVKPLDIAFKESLIYSEIPAAQGCAAKISHRR